MSLSQMLWGSFNLFVIMVHDNIEPRWEQGGNQGPDVVELLLKFEFWENCAGRSNHKHCAGRLPSY